MDGLVGSFTDTATDWRALAAMVAGGMAYRAGRIGILGLGNGSALRVASVGLGLTAEVSTFEITHRSLASFNSTPHGHSNLWRWNGSSGLQQGLLQSFVTFGTLKGVGRLAAGENVIAQHLMQDTAMVLGHQVTGALGIAPRPTGTLAEQFLHAEATNLQIGAGMALAHGFGPGLTALERGLDLSLRAPSMERNFFSPREGGLLQWVTVAPASSRGTPEASAPPEQGPILMAMSGDRAAISSWPPAPAEGVPETAAPGRKISGVIPRQGGAVYPYVSLPSYHGHILSLIRMALSEGDVNQVLVREGRGGLDLEQAAEFPRLRGLLLAEASNRGLEKGIFPRSPRQWGTVQRLIEGAYVHFDLETLRSYREGLSDEWWAQYRQFLGDLKNAQVQGAAVDIPLHRLDRPLPGEYILPRTDRLRDTFLRQFGEPSRSPMENVLLLRDPQRLGFFFASTFNNAFAPVITLMGFLRRSAPEGGLSCLVDPHTPLEGRLATSRKMVSEALSEIPEYLRILKGGEGFFHQAFLRAAFDEANLNRMEIVYEEVRRFVEELSPEVRREIGIEILPPLSEILPPP